MLDIIDDALISLCWHTPQSVGMGTDLFHSLTIENSKKKKAYKENLEFVAKKKRKIERTAEEVIT